MTEPIELSFVVPCDPAHAFAVWTDGISVWWPTSHSVSQDPDLAVTIEPWVGGRIFERASDGTEHRWGDVTAWDAARSFSYRWHLRQDPEDATEVTVSFVEADGGAEVRIVHRGWERLGDRGGAMRERNTQGWSGLLAHYERACSA
jgi:uncharacterized protein YndB with AHSA1/START domain